MPRNQNQPPQGSTNQPPRVRRRATSPSGPPKTEEERAAANEQRRQAEQAARQAGAAGAKAQRSPGGSPKTPRKTREQLAAEDRLEYDQLRRQKFLEALAEADGKKDALGVIKERERKQEEERLQQRWESSLPHGLTIDERIVAARGAITQARANKESTAAAEAQRLAETASKRQATIELAQRIAASMKDKVEPDALLTVTYKEEQATWRGKTTETKVLTQYRGWRVDYKGSKAGGSHYILLPDGRLLSVLGREVRNGPKDVHHVLADESNYSPITERTDSDLATPMLPNNVEGRAQILAVHEAAIQEGLLERYAQIPEDPPTPPPAPQTPPVPVYFYPSPATSPMPAANIVPVTFAAPPYAPGQMPPMPPASPAPYVPGQYHNLPPVPVLLPPTSPVDLNRLPPAPNPGP